MSRHRSFLSDLLGRAPAGAGVAPARRGFLARFGTGSGPAPGPGLVLVLASLALATGPARADGLRVEGELRLGSGIRIEGTYVDAGPELLVPVPRGGLEIDLWSDPDPGYVRVGQKVRFSFRANADCYVMLVSIDTEGRARRLFPGRYDDGWVEGGRVYRLPERRADYDLRFTGPSGEEHVFAIASLAPFGRRLPAWFGPGHGREWGDGCRYGEDAFYESGWCFGDRVHQIYRFTQKLVPYPRDYDTYATSWLRFDVGWRHGPRWWVCSDCGGRIEPGHRGCGRGTIEIVIGVSRGVCDFRRPSPAPLFRYEVCRTVEPRRWHRVFREPVARWRTAGETDRANPDKPGGGRDVGPADWDRNGWSRGRERAEGGSEGSGIERRVHVDELVKESREGRERKSRGPEDGERKRSRSEERKSGSRERGR